MPDPTDFNSKIINEFRTNKGRVGGPFEGATLLLLHTTGARSGAPRVNPVMYRALPAGYAVFASKAGADTDPDWYHNLLVTPGVRAEIGDQVIELQARVAKGEERDRIWTAHKEANPGFAGYEAKTSREIPVVILEPLP